MEVLQGRVSTCPSPAQLMLPTSVLRVVERLLELIDFFAKVDLHVCHFSSNCCQIAFHSGGLDVEFLHLCFDSRFEIAEIGIDSLLELLELVPRVRTIRMVGARCVLSIFCMALIVTGPYSSKVSSSSSSALVPGEVAPPGKSNSRG